jgi:hypothetical protein
MNEKLSAEDLAEKAARRPKLLQAFLRRILSAPGELSGIISEIVTGDELVHIEKSPLGVAVANREAFTDFDRALLLTLARLEMLCDLVRQSPEDVRDATFAEVYARGFVALSHHLTLLGFRRLPGDVIGRLDDRAYCRVLCDPAPVGLSAWADFSRRVREGVTAYAGEKIMEKSTENTAVRPGVGMGSLEVK